MKKIRLLLALCVMVMTFASCQSYRHSMREPNSHVEFVASDFELSEPVTGEATVTHVFFLDWERTFGNTKAAFVGNGTTVPVIGNAIYGGANLALYDLMKKNPGYDVVFYPQVEVHRSAPIFGTDLYSRTTYKVTARLGKMKNK